MSGDYVTRSSRFNERGRRHREDEESRYSEEYEDDVSSTTSSEAKEDRKKSKRRKVTVYMVLAFAASLISAGIGWSQWDNGAEDGEVSQ